MLFIRLTTLIVSLTFAYSAQAQGPNNPKKTISDTDIIYSYEDVDWKPQFPGGDWKFMKFFDENMKLPVGNPEIKKIKKIIARFVVEKDGSITGLEFPEHTLLDKNVRDLFAIMPKWEPGMHKGNNIRVLYEYPILVHIE